LLLGVVVVAAVATVMPLLGITIAWYCHHLVLPLLDVLMLPSLCLGVAWCCRRLVLVSPGVAIAWS